METSFFYKRGDHQFGPVSEQALKQLAADGQLLPSDIVWHAGGIKTIEASQFRDLVFATSPGPPPVPQPASPAAKRLSPPPLNSSTVPQQTSMAAEWFYASKGRQQGPIPFEELKSRAAQGLLQSQDLVWKQGMENWFAAYTIDGLLAEAGGRKAVPPDDWPNLLSFFGPLNLDLAWKPNLRHFRIVIILLMAAVTLYFGYSWLVSRYDSGKVLFVRITEDRSESFGLDLFKDALRRGGGVAITSNELGPLMEPYAIFRQDKTYLIMGTVANYITAQGWRFHSHVGSETFVFVRD